MKYHIASWNIFLRCLWYLFRKIGTEEITEEIAFANSLKEIILDKVVNKYITQKHLTRCNWRLKNTNSSQFLPQVYEKNFMYYLCKAWTSSHNSFDVTIDWSCLLPNSSCSNSFNLGKFIRWHDFHLVTWYFFIPILPEALVIWN